MHHITLCADKPRDLDSDDWTGMRENLTMAVEAALDRTTRDAAIWHDERSDKFYIIMTVGHMQPKDRDKLAAALRERYGNHVQVVAVVDITPDYAGDQIKMTEG